MLDLDDKPLSKHEIFKAKALIKRYDEAYHMAMETKAPFWMKWAASEAYLSKKSILIVALETGKSYKVRDELSDILRLPEMAEAV